MKRYILSAIAFISFISAIAQNQSDALRFSQYIYGGTARFMGMGGAFGALGGDFSSISINPASIGVYRSSEFTITPSMNYNSSRADYLDNKYTDYNNKFLLNNLGFVAAFKSNKTEGWVSTGIGLGYNKLNDFNRTTFITGTNKTSSLLDNFVENANGNPASTLDPYYEKLAYDADLIYNPNLSVTPAKYLNDLTGIWHEKQEQSIQTKGGIGEYVISYGANYNHKLYIGASLGIQHASYNEVISLSETADNLNYPNPYLNSFTFTENNDVHGTGYAFKIGAIYRPIEMLRIGLAVHFPTYYELHSEFSTDLNVNFVHISDTLPDNVSKSSPLGVNDYSLTTPWRMIGSLAYQFGTIGILSMDLERVDYSTLRFNSTSEFKDVNDNIQKQYKAALNLRFGGEVKLGAIALRAGYAMYGSPFANGYGHDNVSNSRISAGVGFRGSRFFCDLAYLMAIQKMDYNLYSVGGVYSQAALNNMSSQIIATIGIRF